MQKGQPADLKTKLGQAVNLALENYGVSQAGRFMELDNENFSDDLGYPYLA